MLFFSLEDVSFAFVHKTRCSDETSYNLLLPTEIMCLL